MNEDDFNTLMYLQKISNKHFDGHLSIMKFTSNWRISIYPPSDRNDIQKMSTGETFDEAAMNFLQTLTDEEKQV